MEARIGKWGNSLALRTSGLALMAVQSLATRVV